MAPLFAIGLILCTMMVGQSNAKSEPATAAALGMQWSFTGPIAGKHCVSFNEPKDPDTWTDNYLCFNQDYGVKFSFIVPIAGMDCASLNDPAEPAAESWTDNFVCVPMENTWYFVFSFNGTIADKSCVYLEEPSDPEFQNNYLCLDGIIETAKMPGKGSTLKEESSKAF